jgi:hypothetical protein
MEISPNSGASSGPAWPAIAPVAWHQDMGNIRRQHVAGSWERDVFAERCGLLTMPRLSSPRGVPAVQSPATKCHIQVDMMQHARPRCMFRTQAAEHLQQAGHGITLLIASSAASSTK